MNAKQKMKIHITTVHERCTVFNCALCDPAFLSKDSMKNNIVLVHEKKKSF